MGLGEPSRNSINAGNTNDGGSSTSDSVKRFPLAVQPEIMRVAEKDDQYATFVYEAYRDPFRHLFGTRVTVDYQNERYLCSNYNWVLQVAGPYGLSPTPAIRALFIFYQSAVSYIAERVSSRAASHGITLADSVVDYSFGDDPTSSNEAEASLNFDIHSSSTSTPSISALSRLKAKIRSLWLCVVRR